MTKFIFITGGVVSGLGKGITAASLAYLLKSHGYTVAMQKFDPYLNVDPGTMSPYHLQASVVIATATTRAEKSTAASSPANGRAPIWALPSR